jgi:hypothetical protein
VVADVRAAVLFALSAHSKTGSDGLQKLKAISRLSGSLDSEALQQYVNHLMASFQSGQLTLAGEPTVLCYGVESVAAVLSSRYRVEPYRDTHNGFSPRHNARKF